VLLLGIDRPKVGPGAHHRSEERGQRGLRARAYPPRKGRWVACDNCWERHQTLLGVSRLVVCAPQTSESRSKVAKGYMLVWSTHTLSFLCRASLLLSITPSSIHTLTSPSLSPHTSTHSSPSLSRISHHPPPTTG
jgi:hypothetical protein